MTTADARGMILSFDCSESPAAADLAAVDAGIDRHNLAEPEIHEVRPIGIIARSVSGQAEGGAVGRSWGECCELQQLWVAEHCRGQGVGSELMTRFEAEARHRGCTLIYLDTFSFQARPFYEKLGFAVVLETKGFTKGIIKYTMHKRLEELAG